ncbi:MAG: tripartite tricarboxylate transporter substrate-binding protein, partial [Microvirga sp.]
MRISSPGLRRSLLAAAALLGLTGAASAQTELKILAPAAPGGGWDQTARSMQQALVQSGAAKSVQVTNIPGAGGTIGIAQFVNSAKGDGNQLMVNGFVMVGAILTNKAPVTLDQVTPIARLTSEYLVIVVPANSPLKTAKDLADRLKAEPGKVTWAGGSAGGVD